MLVEKVEGFIPEGLSAEGLSAKSKLGAVRKMTVFWRDDTLNA
jgi:hypothetical protein